jgi:hypothetical protein
LFRWLQIAGAQTISEEDIYIIKTDLTWQAAGDAVRIERALYRPEQGRRRPVSYPISS